MQTILLVIFAIYGTVIGSFLNVCVYRLPRKLPIARGRSMCPKCGAQLRAVHLSPLVSFVALRRRCRTCGAPISWRYPAVEAATGLLFALSYLRYGLSAHAILICLYLSVLLVVALIDQDTQEIPDRLHVIIAVLAVASFWTSPALTVWEHLIGAVCLSLPMLAVALFAGGFGGGDVKLVAVSGLLLGWRAMLLAALFSSVLAACYGLTLLARHKATLKTQFAFGPWLCLALAAVSLYGDALWRLLFLRG